MIHVTEHGGKMEGIRSISTSVLLNANCAKNAKIPGAICQKCYAKSLCQTRHGLAEALKQNTEVLTSRIIDPYEYPDLSHEAIFRFESFGDLANQTQLENYVAIARYYPWVRFTLYTKMYALVRDFFAVHAIPDNLNIVLSSLKINHPISSKPILVTARPGQVKVFTVYDKKYIKEHPELKINCGSRSCNTCRLCYYPTAVENVNEILKSDQDATEHLIKWRDPVYAGTTCLRGRELLKGLIKKK